MDESFLYTFGLVKANTLSMMRSRGYTTRDPMDPFEEFRAIYTKAKETNCSLAHAATETFSALHLCPMSVVFIDRNIDPLKRKDKMISTDQIKATLQEYPGPKILIVPFKLSPQAKKELAPHKLQVFTFDQMVINIPKHHLYVTHSLCEAQNGEFLPKISVLDPVVRWFNFPVGSVLKIDRTDCPVYRLVA
jgi:DNA-directed RNA polymerase subunit H (RpoH/RPB5)